MWADFFVSAEGACRRGGAVDGNVFCRGGSVCNVCNVCNVCCAFCVCKTHLETYNHIQQTIHDK